MQLHHRFKNPQHKKEVITLCDFLYAQQVSYPKYLGWVKKVEHEVVSGYKHVIVAYAENTIIWDDVFQPRKIF